MKINITLSNQIKELYRENKRSYNCPSCKGKDKLGITEKDNSLIFHCFKCGIKGRVTRTLFKSSRVRVNSLPVGRYQKMFSPPPSLKRTPSTFKLSVLAYLFKYGLGREDILRCRVNSSGDDLIFLVYKDKWLVKYQKRNVLTKWIENHSKEGYAGKGWLLDTFKGEDKRLVLVEDGVSAMKVSRYFPVLCLFGTNISDYMINQIMTWEPYKIYIWLDNDNWRVVQSRHKVQKKLELPFPQKIFMVKDRSDAKNLSEKEILETINNFN